MKALKPYVEETRLAFGPDCVAVWEHPYTAGFLVNLISLTAAEAADPEPTEALSLVQSESWQALTGMPAELIGQKVCLLSIGEDAHFMNGRDDAFVFFEALCGCRRDLMRSWPTVTGVDPSAAYPPATTRPPALLAELWNELLHKRIRRALGGL